MSVPVGEAFAPGDNPGLIVSEGCERNSDAEFRRFLIIARGSCGEVRAQLYLAIDQGHLDEASFISLRRESSGISAMLSAFILRLTKGASG